MPLYMLSLYRAPKQVLSSISNIQRSFLWGKANGSRGIPWVAWTDVCKPKSHGGLGVKDLSKFNESLLGKWKWKRLSDTEALWSKVVNSKYGHGETRNSSRWWKDLSSIGADWFDGSIQKQLGNGASTTFWHDTWIGDEPLKTTFPRLYLLSSLKDAVIDHCGHWRDGFWIWDLPWRRNLFVWELELENDILCILNSVSLSDRPDRWHWTLDKSGAYSVESAYAGQISSTSLDTGDVLNLIWLKGIPAKIPPFIWKLFRGRIPVKMELARRNVMGGEGLECTFCINNAETVDHLFLLCPFVNYLWTEIYRWMDIPFVDCTSIQEAFTVYISRCPSKKTTDPWRTIWFAVVWWIWRSRNDVIFNNRSFKINHIVHCIKMSSWLWLSKNHNRTVLPSFDDWSVSPSYCLMNICNV